MENNKKIDYSHLQKQISYPRFFERFFSSVIDLLIIFPTILATLKPVTKHIVFWIFKYTFKDFLAKEKLFITSIEDLPQVYSHPNYYSEANVHNYNSYGLGIIMLVCIFMSIYFIASWYYYNRTLAKLFFRMKIVDYDSLKKPSLKQYAIRYLGCMVYPIGIWWSIFNKEGRTLHDRLSNTIVIKI